MPAPRPQPRKPSRAAPSGRGAPSKRSHGPARTPRSAPPAKPRGELADRERGVRLNKALANAGVASRREADELIAAGRVTVNGKRVIEMPAWVDLATDRVEVDGRRIHTPRATGGKPARFTYILLHKPKRVITTTSDPQGRQNVLDLIDPAQVRAARLFPVGRLDAESVGLILLTDDGELTNHLTHPRYEVPKHYRVSIRGHVSDQDIESLQKGLILATRGKGPKKAAMEKIKMLGRRRDAKHGDRTTLLVTLREGQNREIRRMVARLGHKVRQLERIALGPLKLTGLAPGQWRPLTGAEVGALYKAAGLKRGEKG